ncbi:hypothetical protein ACJMK2_007831 [Sinanodonta woodiana]|uniref:Poly [ADP-ribose] polymerase n=1 Tax=Sinanodonta woodiana TaxID=1069815 RepID=A0ABD3VLA2_SINWO
MSDRGIQTTEGQHPPLHQGGLPQDNVEREDWVIVGNEDVNYVLKEETCPPFCLQLKQIGLELKDIPGDGNCLFSALGDQIEGHIEGHLKHREDVVKYMMEHRSDFEPFLDVPFEKHIMQIKQPYTHADFDAIVAFARLHQLCIVIHRLNERTSLVQGSHDPKAKQLHIACHDGDHYSSVRKINDNTDSPPNIWIEVGKGQKDVVLEHENGQEKHVAVKAARDTDSLLSKKNKNDQEKHVAVKSVRDTDSLLSKKNKNDQVKRVAVKDFRDTENLLSKEHKNDQLKDVEVKAVRDTDSLLSKEHKNDQLKDVEVKAVRDTDSLLFKEHKNDQLKDGKVRVVTDTESLLSKEHKNDQLKDGKVRVVTDTESLLSKEHKNDRLKDGKVRVVTDTESLLSKEHKNDQLKDGKVRVVTDTESLLVKEVREATGCDDEERILATLLDSSYDVDAAIAIILQEMETVIVTIFSSSTVPDRDEMGVGCLSPPVYPSTETSNFNSNQNQQGQMETIKKGSKPTGFSPQKPVYQSTVTSNTHQNQQRQMETIKEGSIQTGFSPQKPVYPSTVANPVQEMSAAQINPICHRYLVNKCKTANCKFLHHDSIKLPYIWQIRMPNSWLTLDKLQMIKAEKAYSNIKASNCQIELFFEGNTYNAVLEFHTPDNFTAVVSDCGSSSIKTKASVRRLTTMSYAEGTKPSSEDNFKTQWRWFYTDYYGRWHLLEPEFLQFTLEQKFTSKCQDTYLLCRDNYQVNYRINFRNMKQINNQTGKERQLMRRPLFVSAEDVESKHYPKKIAIPTGVNATPLPTGWVPWDLAHAFELVDLTQDSDEFKKVESSFFATLPTQPFQIAYIFRVQNMELWMAYEGQKRSMKVGLERDGQTKEVDERKLFHGTDSVDTVLGICTNNFDFRVCGKNGTFFGRGAYFAQDARYSHRFTNFNRSTRERYMFLAKVLVGEYTNGFPTYTRPPPKPGGKAHKLFDSCVDNIDNPSVFVVFDLKQCYPEYLICYKRLEQFPYVDDILVPPFQTLPPFWIPLVQGQPTQVPSSINAAGSIPVGNNITMPSPASAPIFYSTPQPPQMPSNTTSSQIFYRRQDDGEDNIDMTSCSTGNSSTKTKGGIDA